MSEMRFLYLKRKVSMSISEISQILFNLKEFILMRDRDKSFDEVKRLGSIGIPCFVFEDGRISFDPNDVMK